MVQFLNESNRIEGITEIDYQQPRYQTPDSGHFGAFVDSQRLALDKKPLTIKKIREWQGMLTREQSAFRSHQLEEQEIGRVRNSATLPKNVRVGKHVPPHYEHVPTLLSHWLEKTNDRLKDEEKLKDDAELCRCVGEIFLEFEKIHPFGDGNGRTGRLIANYIETYCGRPITVFNSELREKNRYYEAHDSMEGMTRFMAKKVQEVIFGLNGQPLFRAEEKGDLTSVYQSADGQYRETYDWHVLAPLLEEEVAVEEETSRKRTKSSPEALNEIHN
jgi:hypothetical protein